MGGVAILLALATGTASAETPIGDTPVELMVMHEVSARAATPGMRFRLETVRTVGAIPAGTPAWGEVTDAEPAGTRGRGGRIGARLLHLDWNGRQLRLEGTSDTEARHAGRSVTALSASLGPFALFAKGHDARLKAGETIVGYIAGGPPVADPAGDIVLPAETLVVFETLLPISSESLPRGATVDLVVAEDVLVDGTTLIPKGAKAVAQIVRADAKAAFGQGGRLMLGLHYLETSGRTVRLRGEARWAVRDTPARGLSSSPLAGALGVAITGRRVEVPAGARITGHVLRDTALPRR